MPHSSDDLPSAPPAESVEGQTPDASRPNISDENAADGRDPAGAAAPPSERRPRRRRRRRRHPLAAVAEQAAEGGEAEAGAPVAAAGETAEAAPNPVPGAPEIRRPPLRRGRRGRGGMRRPPQPVQTGGDAVADETVRAAETNAASEAARTELLPGAPAQAEPGGERRRWRRRRRPRRAEGPDGAPGGGEARGRTEGVVEVISRSQPATIRRLRIDRLRPRRRRRETEAQPEARETGQRERRPAQQAEPRDSARQGRGFRSPRPRGKGPGERQGRGRDAPQKRPDLKLYALESVVDRGFEDVTDEANENGTRRVHWTIVKRTVADQKSGKPMSAVYVLERDGVQAEFPNLGAARAAVNKTIVHPEKLTLSKAEHAAAKSER
jgi:hypothetical protein